MIFKGVWASDCWVAFIEGDCWGGLLRTEYLRGFALAVILIRLASADYVASPSAHQLPGLISHRYFRNHKTKCPGAQAAKRFSSACGQSIVVSTFYPCTLHQASIKLSNASTSQRENQSSTFHIPTYNGEVSSAWAGCEAV